MGGSSGITLLMSHGLPNLASQQHAVIREKFLLTLWCKPEANKMGTSLHQVVALCRASLLKVTRLPQLAYDTPGVVCAMIVWMLQNSNLNTIFVNKISSLSQSQTVDWHFRQALYQKAPGTLIWFLETIGDYLYALTCTRLTLVFHFI